MDAHGVDQSLATINSVSVPKLPLQPLEGRFSHKSTALHAGLRELLLLQSQSHGVVATGSLVDGEFAPHDHLSQYQ
jgi:hypothetical protein